MTVICVIAVVLSLSYASFNFFSVKNLEEGTPQMQKIAKAIRLGANTFLKREYGVLVWTCAILFALISIFLSFSSGVAFLLGATMSGLAGIVGMRIATYANVRVTNRALETRNIGKTLKVALAGGSVMGLCVSGFALLGLLICYIVFGYQLNNIQNYTNWAGISFIPYAMTITSYALGCSVIAIFNRVGGGIYTKAADMGADLVGKTEVNIPEDDYRNPGTIADNVGDNVGDVAGLGSDLLESYVGAIVSAVVLAIHIYISLQGEISVELFRSLYTLPIAFSAIGLISCVLGLAFVLTRDLEDNPHKELNRATTISAALTILGGLVLTVLTFKGKDISALPFNLGMFSPWISAVLGIMSGIAIGKIAEYYTSYSYKPTLAIAKASEEGPAITVTQGLSVGMKSCMYSLFVIGFALLISYYACGTYGVAISAMGMLSFVATTVSVDTYGPISDNAGGIAEMAKLPEEVREITDQLDAVGNTTAAIGKGFAIGSAAFATLSLMISYLYSFNLPQVELTLNILNPLTLAGILVGGALPYYFSGMLIDSVSKTAQVMVEEIRRQFRNIKGIITGETDPDSEKCIDIATQGSLAEMRRPALIAILFPVIGGFVLGPLFVGGILFGSTISAIMLAIFCGNAGGAWDNAKKYLEVWGCKGSEAHKAAVVGDTVGDPLKDTVGPSLDIFIKIMATVSTITVPIFSQFNLLDLLRII